MRKSLIPVIAACSLQGTQFVSAQPAKPDAPAKPEAPVAVDPDAQYVLGPEAQPQAGVGGRSY